MKFDLLNAAKHAGVYKSGRQVTVATFCTVTPNICGYSTQKVFHDALLTPGILRWLFRFLEYFGTLRRNTGTGELRCSAHSLYSVTQ